MFRGAVGHAGATPVVRQQRLARWQVFQPTTRSYLEQVAVVGGAALAEQLAEAIRREREQLQVAADQHRRVAM